MDKEKDWLESLEIGDEVAVCSRGKFSIETVTKVTRTQIVTQYGRYRKDTGYSVGVSIWNLANIKPVTDAIRETIKKSQLRSELTKQNFNGLSLDQLERIKSIIDEGKQ